MTDGRSDAIGFAGGCALLLVLHFAGLGAVTTASALLGAPEGDVGLVLYVGAVYVFTVPFVQVGYGGVAAAALEASGSRGAVLGVGAGVVLTLLIGGPVSALLYLQAAASFHP